MKKRKIAAIAAVCVAVAAIAGGIIWHFSGSAPEQKQPEQLQSYDAQQRLQEALERLKTTDEEAEIIRGIDTSERVVALTLDGMANAEQMKEIISLLESNNVQATFFPEGKLAAEDSDTVEAIKEKGFGVESYTLYGNKHMEELTPEEMTEDFVKAKNVLDELTKSETSILRCNNSKLTSELLHAAGVSGYNAVVEPTVILSSTSFATEEAALGYVQKIKSGSIISVKLHEQLDAEEIVTEERPAIDKQASLETEEIAETEPVDIVTMLSYLINALNDANFTTILVKDIPTYEENLDQTFNEIETGLGNEMADVYTSIPVKQNWIGCSFRGIKNGEMLDTVLELLKETESHATFFVTGNDIGKYPDRIEKILEQGHTVENGGYAGMTVAEQPFSDVYLEIEDCDKLLNEKLSIESKLYQPLYGRFDVTTRKAAKALDYSIVTYNKNPITDKEKSVEEIMQYFTKGLKRGDVVYFDLNYYDDLPAVLKAVIELAQSSKLSMVSTTEMFHHKVVVTTSVGNGKKTAGAKNAGSSVLSPSGTSAEASTETSTENNEAEQTEKELLKYFAKLQTKNKGKLAEEIKDVKIVDDSVVFLFYGITKKAVVDDVLTKLAGMDAKATFFIDADELTKYADSVKKIKKAGHEIGIAVKPLNNMTYEQACHSIYDASVLLKDKYKIEPKNVLQPWGTVSDVTREAISAMGYTLIGHDTTIVHERDLDETSPQQILDGVFGNNYYALKQGQILYFRMDFYNNNKLLGKVIKLLKEQLIDSICYKPSDHSLPAGDNYNGYQITGIESLLAKNDNMYVYPLTSSQILAEVQGKITPGTLPAERLMELLKARYIGAAFAQSTSEFVEFTEEEIEQLDRDGQINTDDNVIFFTFDDWGSDATLNKLLHVLDKHGVTGVFFVRTNYVENNPNLLRKIALAGHHLASHTDEHLTLANRDEATGLFEPLSKSQLKELKSDIVLSYDKLTQITGDVSINGRPALTTWFRPPTLAISKPALQTVLGCGYNYIISGNISTHDYEAQNAATLYNEISTALVDENGVLKNGSVIIMHMSDDSMYTAEALDRLMTDNDNKGDSDPTKFTVGNLADYLSVN